MARTPWGKSAGVYQVDEPHGRFIKGNILQAGKYYKR
jgi:hypothetical protein